MNIRTKILGAYLLLALLFVGIYFYALSVSKAALLDAAGRNTIRIARKISKRMNQNLAHRIEEMKLLGEGDTIIQAVTASSERVAMHPDLLRLAALEGHGKADEDGVSSELAAKSLVGEFSQRLNRLFIRFFEVEYGQRSFQGVAVYNRYGFMVGEAGDTRSGHHEDHEEWWTEVVKEGTHVCMASAAERGNGSHSIAVAVKLADPEGRFVGVLKAIVPIMTIIRPAEIIIQEYRTTTLRLMHADGQLLYASTAFPLGKSLAGEPFFRRLQGEKGYFLSRSPAGRETLLGYVKASEYGHDNNLAWIVVIEHDAREVLTGITTLKQQIYVAMGLALLLVVIMLFVMHRDVTSPLIALRDGAYRVAKGELGVQLPIVSTDEIGEVATAFNQMTAKLAESYHELQEENRKKREAQEDLARQAELLVRRNEELARRNADLDEFTYVASHDLQEPLRKITAFSNLLVQDLDGAMPEQAATDLAFMTDAAARMQVLIYDLLAFSRSGRVAMARGMVPLDQCVDQAMEALSVTLAESGAEIVRGPLPAVNGDPALLGQLFQNLIGNAVKFSRPGERSVVEVTVEEDEANFILGVKDNGIGFKQEYDEQIFQPFKRLHGREEFAGSGIGLAICRKIVERHNGRIWVESTPGEGTHFRFSLPKEAVPQWETT